MKLTRFASAWVLGAFFVTAWPTHAQYSARRFTRRVLPTAPARVPQPAAPNRMFRGRYPFQRPQPVPPSEAGSSTNAQTEANPPAANQGARPQPDRRLIRRYSYPYLLYGTNAPADKAEDPEVVHRVVEFQKKRAAEGQPSAQYELGVRYLTGNGVEKDPKEGKKWLELAAKNGSVQAKKKLNDLNKTAPEPAEPEPSPAPPAKPEAKPKS